MASKKKQLTLTPQNIQQENAKYKQLKKVTFTNGQYTELYTHFHHKQIHNMIKDLGDFLSELETRKGKIDTEDFYMYFTLHAILHFTTICPTPPSDLAEKIEFLNHLSDHPCVFELKDALPEKELAKVWEAMFKQLENVQKLMEQDTVLKAKFKSEIAKLDNPEIISELMFGGEQIGNNESKAT